MKTFEIPLHRGPVTTASRASAQRGASLIEILVAVLLLSFGILGMAGMQYAGTKFNQGATLRTQGTALAYDLADRARANLAACSVGGICVYATELTAVYSATATSASACGQPIAAAANAADLAAVDVNQWKSCVENALPVGRGRSVLLAANTAFVDQCGATYAGTAREVFVVEVNWNDGRLNSGANNLDCVVVRTEVRPL